MEAEIKISTTVTTSVTTSAELKLSYEKQGALALRYAINKYWLMVNS